MKIGILTHQYINNYGAFLQAWALRKAISELFPEDEVQIIDYVNVKHYIINAGGWFRFYKNRETLKEWFAKVQLPNTFAKARNQEMVLSKRCFNARQINELEFDCIVVGSDEVWNYRDTKGNAELKFGVGLTCKNLIAYPTEKNRINKIRSLLSDMKIASRLLEVGCEDDFIPLLDTPMDYTETRNYIAQKIQEADDFLTGDKS